MIYPYYQSAAQSQWRAQELSLFDRYASSLQRPIADFGCGDGSFSSVLWNRLEIGIDNDPAAIIAAGKCGLYERLVQSEESTIPLPTDSVGSIVSNSVLEHLRNLEEILAELCRVLRPGGTFLFTVPTPTFTLHLEKYFGKEEAIRVNEEYYHRNLQQEPEWCRLLEQAGFVVRRVRHYQPGPFTYCHRMLRVFGRHSIGRLFPRVHGILWRIWAPQMIRMVRDSIENTRVGANILVEAEKRA
jgi:SAM-dependent methyltransferase